MSSGWEEIEGEVDPEAQPVLSGALIQQAYEELKAALINKQSCLEFCMQEDGHYDQLELAEVGVELARAEVDRVVNLMRMWELEIMARGIQTAVEEE
jgi:hypothetical protein